MTLRLASFALPVWCGLTVLLWAVRSDVGVLLGLLLGLSAAVATLLAGRAILASRLALPLRASVAALFAIPAGMAGFNVVSGCMRLAGSGQCIASVGAGFGALAIGMAALMSLAIPGRAARSDRGAGVRAGWGTSFLTEADREHGAR